MPMNAQARTSAAWNQHLYPEFETQYSLEMAPSHIVGLTYGVQPVCLHFHMQLIMRS